MPFDFSILCGRKEIGLGRPAWRVRLNAGNVRWIGCITEGVLNMKVRIEELAMSRDERGCVFEPLSGEDLQYQVNVHVVLTKPGMWRANHYHNLGTEILIAYGPALVRYRDDEAIVDVSVPEGSAMRFTIPPGVSHAIRNTGELSNLVVAFNSQAHDPSNPDTVRDSLMEG